jgi:hypothetical protein
MVAVIAGLTAATASVSPAGAAPVPGWFMLSQGNDKACASIYWGVPGGAARLASCTHHTRDRVFTLVPDGTHVRIRSEMNACLAIPTSSWMPGTLVESGVCTAGKGVQQWQMQSEFGGTVRFYQPLTGLCLDTGDAQLTLLSPLVLGKCGAPTQNWATVAAAEPTPQPLVTPNHGGCIRFVPAGDPILSRVTWDRSTGWQSWCFTSPETTFWYQPADNGGGAFVLPDGRCFSAQLRFGKYYYLASTTCSAPVGNETLWAPSRLNMAEPTYLIANVAHPQCINFVGPDAWMDLYLCNPNIENDYVAFAGAV